MRDVEILCLSHTESTPRYLYNTRQGREECKAPSCFFPCTVSEAQAVLGEFVSSRSHDVLSLEQGLSSEALYRTYQD